METAEIRIPIDSSARRYRIYNVGDIHAGGSSFDEKAFRKTVRSIVDDPYAYWVGTGDYGEFINYTDKRFDGDSVPDFMSHRINDMHMAQVEYIGEDLLAPIWDKCLGLLKGNHEYTILSHYHTDPVHELLKICGKKAAAKDLGFGRGIIRITFDRQGEGKQPSYPVLINAAHGTGGGMYAGGNLNYMIRLSADDDCDIYMRAHVHKMLDHLITCFHYPRGGKLKAIARYKALLICGAYLKTYEEGVASYAERRDMRPVIVGSNWVDIKLDPLRMRTTSETPINWE